MSILKPRPHTFLCTFPFRGLTGILPLALAVLVLDPAGALAHKVIASAWATSGLIQGEVGLSNGNMAAGLALPVRDSEGNALGQTVTDEEGFFTFSPVRKIDHIFYVDLGSGHKAEILVPAADIIPARGGSSSLFAATAGPGSAPAAPPSGSAAAPGAIPGDFGAGTADIAASRALADSPAAAAPGRREAETEALRAMIREEVRMEIRPLRRAITAWENKNDLQTILGGIGYILGLTGIGFFFAARHKLKALQK